MALCDVCGNFDDEHTDGEPSIRALPDYQPDLYYYWDYPIEENIIGEIIFLILIVFAKFVLI